MKTGLQTKTGARSGKQLKLLLTSPDAAWVARTESVARAAGWKVVSGVKWPKTRDTDVLWVCDWSEVGHAGVMKFAQGVGAVTDARVLVVGEAPELFWAELALRSGARGFLLKSAPPEEFTQAVRDIGAGRVHFSPAVFIDLTRAILSRAEGDLAGGLSVREIEILRGIARGAGAREIAQALKLSVRTVETHVSNIRSKLGAAGTEELRAFAPRCLELLGPAVVPR